MALNQANALIYRPCFSFHSFLKILDFYYLTDCLISLLLRFLLSVIGWFTDKCCQRMFHHLNLGTSYSVNMNNMNKLPDKNTLVINWYVG